MAKVRSEGCKGAAQGAAAGAFSADAATPAVRDGWSRLARAAGAAVAASRCPSATMSGPPTGTSALAQPAQGSDSLGVRAHCTSRGADNAAGGAVSVLARAAGAAVAASRCPSTSMSRPQTGSSALAQIAQGSASLEVRAHCTSRGADDAARADEDRPRAELAGAAAAAAASCRLRRLFWRLSRLREAAVGAEEAWLAGERSCKARDAAPRNAVARIFHDKWSGKHLFRAVVVR